MAQEFCSIFERPGKADLELVCSLGEPKDFENEPGNTLALVLGLVPLWLYIV